MSSSAAKVVRSYFIDNIGVIAIANPPVNAISAAVRQGIVQALDELNKTEVEHIILHCEGNTFSAGADIKEFNQTPVAPHLPDVIVALNSNPIPVVALIHGTCLGGGLELAMACDIRVATETCRIGLPEVNLGLIPGAGGTQLLPKLVGIEKAAEMITSGRLYPVSEFVDTGLIHTILPIESDTSSKNLLKHVVRMKSQLSDSNKHPLLVDDVNWEEIKSKTERQAKGRIAPLKAIDVIQSTYDVPLEVGLKMERKVFLELRESPQSMALRHAFVAEKTAAKYRYASKAKSVASVAVIGGGTMGSGIATALLNAGFQVTLVEQQESQVTKAKNSVIKHIQAALSRGLITSTKFHQTIGLLQCTSSLAEVVNSDLVIEAIFEDLSAKQQLFKNLDDICSDNTVFATNTSYLDIEKMADELRDPSRLVGMHFFSPAHIMKLLEVVKTTRTSESAIATAFAVAKRARKIPVLAANCYGFAGNRMYQRYGREIQQLLLEGATVQDIDEAMTQFGMAMGPLAVQDLAGIDIGHKARTTQSFPANDPGFFKVSEMLYEQGNFGRKTGKGFYNYASDQTEVNDVIDQQIAELAVQLGISKTYPDRATIQHRALMALISEGYQIMAEKVVERTSDLDVIWLYGYGFPRYMGGPMHQAEVMGDAYVTSALQKLRETFGEAIWPEIKL